MFKEKKSLIHFFFAVWSIERYFGSKKGRAHKSDNIGDERVRERFVCQ